MCQLERQKHFGGKMGKNYERASYGRNSPHGFGKKYLTSLPVGNIYIDQFIKVHPSPPVASVTCSCGFQGRRTRSRPLSQQRHRYVTGVTGGVRVSEPPSSCSLSSGKGSASSLPSSPLTREGGAEARRGGRQGRRCPEPGHPGPGLHRLPSGSFRPK